MGLYSVRVGIYQWWEISSASLRGCVIGCTINGGDFGGVALWWWKLASMDTFIGADTTNNTSVVMTKQNI